MNQAATPAETFESEQSATSHLLHEVTGILGRCSVHFVVVGGWVPYLFHAEKYGHPGTYDVDILLHSDSLDDGTFKEAGERLLSSGFLRAAKNRFQAHRVLRIGQEELVFHVDFLNETNDDEFVMVGGKGRLWSIYTPAMKAIFEYEEFRSSDSFPGVLFPSPETFIATKAAAALVKSGLVTLSIFSLPQRISKQTRFGLGGIVSFGVTGSSRMRTGRS